MSNDVVAGLKLYCWACRVPKFEGWYAQTHAGLCRTTAGLRRVSVGFTNFR